MWLLLSQFMMKTERDCITLLYQTHHLALVESSTEQMIQKAILVIKMLQPKHSIKLRSLLLRESDNDFMI